MAETTYDRFWVRAPGRRWHLAERQEVRHPRTGLLVVVYVLRCSEEALMSEVLEDIEREIPDSAEWMDVCGHNPCAREKKRRRGS